MIIWTQRPMLELIYKCKFTVWGYLQAMYIDIIWQNGCLIGLGTIPLFLVGFQPVASLGVHLYKFVSVLLICKNDQWYMGTMGYPTRYTYWDIQITKGFSVQSHIADETWNWCCVVSQQGRCADISAHDWTRARRVFLAPVCDEVMQTYSLPGFLATLGQET